MYYLDIETILKLPKYNHYRIFNHLAAQIAIVPGADLGFKQRGGCQWRIQEYLVGGYQPAGGPGAKPLATKLNITSRLIIICEMPKCTTVVQTKNDLLESEIELNSPKNYNFWPLIGQKNPKIFRY